jgi:protein SCO1
VTLTALLWCGSLQCAWAQDVYRTPDAWLDDQARSFRFAELRGTPTIVTMAYGACRRVCSTSLRVLEQLQAAADERSVALNFVVVGLDSSQDKPADWAQYRLDRRLNRSNWRFLSGDEASTRRLADRLGFHYWRYGEHTMHDFRVLLLAPDGQVVRSLERFDQSVTTLLP